MAILISLALIPSLILAILIILISQTKMRFLSILKSILIFVLLLICISTVSHRAIRADSLEKYYNTSK